MAIRGTATRRLALLLALLAVTGGALSAGEIEIASRGKARLPIVLPRGAGEVEQAAAEELASYLRRVTGARFKVKKEPRRRKSPPGIYVGDTEFARHLGLRPAPPDSEAWHVVTHGERLVLAGESPRGTLYAVHEFLGREVGVRWWTPWEETVPRNADLRIPRTDRGGEPAFRYRDFTGIGGPRLFCARHQVNGHFSFLAERYGGRESYGPPGQVHNLFQYVPPEELFETHPEFFSEIDGVRTSERAQLCLSNPALAELVSGRLRAFIEQARAEAHEKGVRPSRVFNISQNDCNGACECAACRALVDGEEGRQSAPLVVFINRIARSIAEDYPDVLLDTLAYGHTLDPPPTSSYEANVSLRLAALYGRNFAAPITAPEHAFYREAIEGWSRRTAHLRIWDYAVTFGKEAGLPLPTLPVLATDLRYYLDHGVEGLFLQFDRPVVSDMRDLKLWVTLELVQDPRRDPAVLVREFTEGYYGPAGGPIRNYLQLLEKALAGRPASIEYPPGLSDYGYLDRAFLLQAQSLFDVAEARAEGDEELLQRVRRARLSLDRATVLLWEDRFGNEGRIPQGDGRVLWLRGVAERCRNAARQVIDERLPEWRRERERKRIDRELGPIVARYEELDERSTP